jgi:rare lipoprotein A
MGIAPGCTRNYRKSLGLRARARFGRLSTLHNMSDGPESASGSHALANKLFTLVFLAIAASGCASRRPIATSTPPVIAPEPAPPAPSAPSIAPPPSTAPAPGIYVEQGIASWYGLPFHGRRAANGEVFDMNSLVAAHRTLPFGSILRVTNLNNGRQVVVRVIDRGPFARDRVLDLARAAAIGLDMIGTGTAPVRIELLSGPSPVSGDFTVQVGAFSNRDNAERLRDRLLDSYQPIFIQDFDAPNVTGHFYRVLVGRVPNSEAAQQLAGKLRNAEGFHTFVMRLDQPNDSGAE